MLNFKKISYDKDFNPLVGEQGFTLVELMIAMLISGIVISSIYTAFRSQQRNYLAQEQVSEMQQNIRAGIGLLVKEIRMAGYDPESEAGAEIVSANDTSLSFTFVADDDNYDNDGDNVTDENNEIETIQYGLYDAYSDGSSDLGRQVGASKRAVAENIEQLEFYYILDDGSQTLNPASTDDIRGVEISLLARARKPDQTFTNRETYTTASGANWTVNDHYRRRFHTITVECRNMGL